MGLTGKEYHIKFVRKKNKLFNGYHRKVTLIRANAPAFKQPGLLHRIDSISRRIEGDKPNISITKKIENMHPTTIQGKSAKVTLSAVNKVRKIGTSGAWKTALSAETVAITAGNIAGDKLIQNLRYNADTSDSGKAVLSTVTTIRTLNNARKAVHQHGLQKKQHKTYVNAVKGEKVKLKKAKNKFTAEKESYKTAKADLKNKLRTISKINTSKSPNINKLQKLKKKHKIYQNIRRKNKLLKSKVKSERTQYKVQKKNLKNKKKLKKYSKSKPLLFKGIGTVATSGISRASNRLAQSAPDNDFVQATSKAVNTVRHTKSVKRAVRNHKISKAEKRSEKLNKKSNKLQQRRNKLQRKSQLKRKRRKTPKPKSKVKDKVQQLAVKFIGFIFKFFAAISAPLLIIIFILAIVLSLFGGGVSHNSAVLGTYYCNDYDMAQLIESYTDIAYCFNEKVIKCKNRTNWKSGLNSLGVDTSEMYDTPTSFVFGRNLIQNYDPVYDFDANKLIAFMCAYTYDFTDSEDKQQTWKYKSEYDDVLQDLFDKEYKFESRYVNGSYWQQRNSYIAYPGEASDDMYLSKKSGSITVSATTYGYIDFGSCGVPYTLSSYADNTTVYFDLSTGEIKNYNKNYAKTGYYFQNLNKKVIDPDGNIIPAFYSMVSNGSETFLGWRGQGTTVYRKTQLTVGGNNFDWAVAKEDVQKRFGENNKQAVRFYRRDEYITDCTLYTNVKRVRTFDEAIYTVLHNKSYTLSDSTNDFNQRKQYYQILACLEQDENGNTTDTYGLHQAFKCSPLPGNFNDAEIYNNFGYDLEKWGSRHCKNTIHYGTDLVAQNGTNVYSLIDGKVESIDTANHTIVIITTEDKKFWYEDDTKHTVKITYGNIKAKSTLNVGSIVKLGDYIGKVDSYRHCDGNDTNANKNYLHIGVQIKYGIFDWDWHDVDPQFLIYRENS